MRDRQPARDQEIKPDPLAIYLHIPFCQTKCHYCDFNSYRGMGTLIGPLVSALEGELRLWAETAGHHPVGSIFLGGGTPSLLAGAQVQALLDTCRRGFAVAPDTEISLEANPGTVDAQHLATYRQAGANRLSLGVQSLHNDELQWLGRRHSAEEARRACRLARSAGFRNINLDLIFGLPGQPLSRWRETLEGALELGPEHLSCYALTVEEETPLGKAVAQGRVSAPDSDAQAEMYSLAEELLAVAGYEHYELSNWALPGRRCRHNLVYWRCRPYLGLGPGAHSYLRGWRFAGVRSPRQYIEALTGHGGRPLGGVHPEERRAPGGTSPVILSGAKNPRPREKGERGLEELAWDPRRVSPAVAEAERMSLATDMADTVILGLRLAEGVSRADFRRRFRRDPSTRSGRDLADVYAAQIAELASLGLVELTPQALRLTPRGRLLGNEAFVRFLPRPR